MKQSFKLGTKIWLSLTILVSGYLISMLLVFILGKHTESRLRQVSEYLIPAAQQSQLALTAFNEQIKLYNNAVITGDESLVESANLKAIKTLNSLKIIVKLDYLSLRKKNEIIEVLVILSKFSRSAQHVYTVMCSVFDGEERDDLIKNTNAVKITFEDMAASLAKETSKLREKLNKFAETFALDLKIELTSISRLIKQYQYLNMIIFFCVVIITLSLISIIIKRSIIRPLMRLVDIAGDITEGKKDIEWLPETTDEIGKLNHSLRIMTEDLKAAEKKYRSIYENAVQGIFQVSQEGHIISVNPSLIKMLGYDSQEEFALFLTKYHYVNNDERKNFFRIINKKGYVKSFKTMFYRKNKTKIWVSISARLIKDIDNNILYYEGSIIDITERIEKEKAERERKVAEAANKSKSEFLANMSHEIRTPMNAIMGMSHLALQTELTPKQHEYLSTIQSSSQSLLGIINDILDFSKIEAGKMNIESVDFYPDEILNNLYELISITAKEKGLKIILKTGDDVPRSLVGDPLRLGQVLINLSNNAVKFTKTGEILILTEVIKRESNQVKLKFSVQDTGIGLTEEQINKLFNAFTQADTSTTRKYGGTGLGLTICKRLVEMMGGEICVASEPEKGSTFSFTTMFGLHSEDLESKISDSNEHIETTDHLDNIKGANILLVEDNENNLLVATMLLDEFDMNITIAKNGKEAVQAVESSTFDLVLMDIQMPVMDGYEATAKIRSNSDFNQLPIIAMTAHAMAGYREKCLKAGMDDYISKPIDPDNLFNCLAKWIPEESKN
ncbi:two-component system, sensor histidine kinase [Candidatus Magnetomoraceae bacterium gMMP-1]